MSPYSEKMEVICFTASDETAEGALERLTEKVSPFLAEGHCVVSCSQVVSVDNNCTYDTFVASAFIIYRKYLGA